MVQVRAEVVRRLILAIIWYVSCHILKLADARMMHVARLDFTVLIFHCIQGPDGPGGRGGPPPGYGSNMVSVQPHLSFSDFRS